MDILGLLAVILYLGGIAIVLRNTQVNDHKTFSDHVAHGMPRVLFNTLGAIGSGFYIGWLLSLDEVPVEIRLLLVFAIIVFLVGLVIPRRGAMTFAHDVTARIVGVCMLVSFLFLLFDNALSLVFRAGIIGIYAVLLVISGQLLLPERPGYLYRQVAFYVIVHCALLMIFTLGY